MSHEGQRTVERLSAGRYVLPSSVLDSSRPENKGFCEETPLGEKCLASGVLNITSCNSGMRDNLHHSCVYFLPTGLGLLLRRGTEFRTYRLTHFLFQWLSSPILNLYLSAYFFILNSYLWSFFYQTYSRACCLNFSFNYSVLVGFFFCTYFRTCCITTINCANNAAKWVQDERDLDRNALTKGTQNARAKIAEMCRVKSN